LPWDATHPYSGLGWREIEAESKKGDYEIHEHPLVKA
jgi:hypothetical protein